jgi:hypothetical protein
MRAFVKIRSELWQKFLNGKQHASGRAVRKPFIRGCRTQAFSSRREPSWVSPCIHWRLVLHRPINLARNYSGKAQANAIIQHCSSSSKTSTSRRGLCSTVISYIYGWMGWRAGRHADIQLCTKRRLPALTSFRPRGIIAIKPLIIIRYIHRRSLSRYS